MVEQSPYSDDVFSSDAQRVFERYYNMVYRLAFSRTGNKADADDILQEVFLRYIRLVNPPETVEHLKALLIRITINCSKSLSVSAWNKKTQGLDDNLSAKPQEYNETFDAVMRLPVKYRTVIHLYYYCGYSVDEISELLECGASAVKSRLMRARNKLKSELEGVDLDVSG